MFCTFNKAGGCALAIIGENGNLTLYLVSSSGQLSSSAAIYTGGAVTSVELYDYAERRQIWVFYITSRGVLQRVSVGYQNSKLVQDTAMIQMPWSSLGFIFPITNSLFMLASSAELGVVDMSSRLYSVVPLQPCKCPSGMSFQTSFPLGDFNTGVCVQPPVGSYVDSIGGLSVCLQCLRELALQCPLGTTLRGVVCAWSASPLSSLGNQTMPSMQWNINMPQNNASGVLLQQVSSVSDLGLVDSPETGNLQITFEISPLDGMALSFSSVLSEASALWGLVYRKPVVRNRPPHFDYVQEYLPFSNTNGAAPRGKNYIS